MNAKLPWVVLLVMALSVGAPGQDYEEPRRPQRIPTEGFWPTRLMIDRFIDRATEDMAKRYELDEDQLYQTREVLKERLPRWLNDNRARIQTVVNEFIEAQLNDEAPAVEHVAEWSQRVLPLVNEFQEQVVGMTDEMRDFMTEEQQVMLEGELAAFKTGLTMTTNKLNVWADGGYDPETEWHRNRQQRREIDRAERERLEAEMEAARQQARTESAGRGAGGRAEAAVAADRPAEPRPERIREVASRETKPTDEWAAYVEAFKRRYDLNDDQRAKADSLLKRHIEQRDHYLRRNGDRMKEITKFFKNPETRERAQKEYDRLNIPVKRMFKSLKQKLEKLPTRAQRKAAGQATLKPEAAEQKSEGPR